MSFDRRKVYIEFLGKEAVMLVTPFKSKTFQLTEGCTIDLISLTKHASLFMHDSDFFAIFEYDDEQKFYQCAVHMRIAEHEIDEIGECSIFDNKKVYSGSVWIND